MTEATISRRKALQTGAALAAAGAAGNLGLFAQAWAQDAPWKPEPGAKLTLLRCKGFFRPIKTS